MENDIIVEKEKSTSEEDLKKYVTLRFNWERVENNEQPVCQLIFFEENKGGNKVVGLIKIFLRKKAIIIGRITDRWIEFNSIVRVGIEVKEGQTKWLYTNSETPNNLEKEELSHFLQMK
jgi:hypothetical protein